MSLEKNHHAEESHGTQERLGTHEGLGVQEGLVLSRGCFNGFELSESCLESRLRGVDFGK
jgi:hypothetical protein